MKSTLRNALKLAVATTLVVTTLGSTAIAATAATPSTKDRGKYCEVVLEKIQPGQQFSRQISKKCSNNAADIQKSAEYYDLVTIWEDANFGGQFYTFRGTEPCDAAGYGWREFTWWWDNKASSMKVFNNCKWSAMYADINYGGDVKNGVGDYPFIGHEMNDRMSSLIVQA